MLRNILRLVERNEEVRWSHTTLGGLLRHQEEVEASVNHFRLLDEALVHVGALRRVVNKRWGVAVLRLLEEALTHTLVNNDQGHLGQRDLLLALFELTVLLSDDFVELVEFEVDDLLAHGVANTVTVDEDMVGHLAAVVRTVALEGAHEVVGQNGARDNLLALLGLWGGLGVVLAHVLVVSRTEANCGLLALVAHVDTYKHCLVRDFGPEAHAPKIAAELGVHLTDDVQEDAVVILHDCAVSNEL